MIAVRNTLWMGAAGVYPVTLAEHGFFSQLWAQTSTCVDCAPFGGIDGTFSTNPVGFAFPIKKSYASVPGTVLSPMHKRNNPDIPVVISDFSTASMSLGKANTLITAGEKAPEEIFLDKNGKLTDDPRVMKDKGTLLFFGGKNYGYKGYGMSLWCEALTAMAGGSANNLQSKTRQSFNLTVIDPAAFEGTEYYYSEIGRFIARVKQSRLRPGYKEIRLPGERSLKQLIYSQEHGIDVNIDLLIKLNDIAGKYGIKK
ncbi:MAG: Ldh family oxidoreductase [Spirochaetes bacterium]|nr:Ldh family oxidoreductase [Spirochaetota bacterium]